MLVARNGSKMIYNQDLANDVSDMFVMTLYISMLGTFIGLIVASAFFLSCVLILKERIMLK